MKKQRLTPSFGWEWNREFDSGSKVWIPLSRGCSVSPDPGSLCPSECQDSVSPWLGLTLLPSPHIRKSNLNTDILFAFCSARQHFLCSSEKNTFSKNVAHLHRNTSIGVSWNLCCYYLLNSQAINCISILSMSIDVDIWYCVNDLQTCLRQLPEFLIRDSPLTEAAGLTGLVRYQFPHFYDHNKFPGSSH